MVRIADRFQDIQAAAGHVLFKGGRVADCGEDHDPFALQVFQRQRVLLDAFVPVRNFYELLGMVDTFDNRRFRIVLPDIFRQAGTGQQRALVRLRKEEHIGAVQMAQRFAQDTAGQQIAVTEQVQRIHKDDIQVAV